MTSTPPGPVGTAIDRTMVDAVLFDAGGVLVLPDPSVLAPTLAPYGADATVAAHTRAHYGAMRAKSRAGHGETDWDTYDLAYVRLLGVAAHEEAEAAVVLGATRNAHLWRAPIPGAAAALQALHEAGVPIGIVSNASGQIENVLRRFGVCQVGAGDGAPVRFIVDSHVVGVAKPDPAIFSHGLAGLDAPDPARILYVGDSVSIDVRGARAAGLVPVLVDPFEDWPEADFLRIRCLDELVTALVA